MNKKTESFLKTSGGVRNYPTSKGIFLRKKVGQKLKLQYKPPIDGKQIQVVAWTNINHEEDWREEAFYYNTELQRFALSLSLSHPGKYCFKVRYSDDGGRSWHWDKADYSYLMVDPSWVAGLSCYVIIPNVSGPISQWKKQLAHIKNMGFNWIQLLPLSAMDTSQSPYAASKLLEFDPIYGENAELDFKDFVKEAHSMGFALGVDLVFNHVGIGSQICKHHPEWIVGDCDEEDGFKRAGWWRGDEWVKWEELVLINYKHPEPKTRKEIWEYMRKYALYWCSLIQGNKGVIRLDNFHSSHGMFIRFIIQSIHQAFPDMIVLAEFFDKEPVMLNKVWNNQLHLLLATPWESKFVPELRRYVGYIHESYNSFKYFFPITSHDSGTPAQEFGDVKATYPRYALSSLAGTGVTGMVQGVECGLDKKINFIGPMSRLQEKPIPDFCEFIGKINGLANSESVFWTHGNLLFFDENHEAIIAFQRLGKYYHYLVLCNFDIFHNQSLQLKKDNIFLSGSGEWLLESCLWNKTEKPLELVQKIELKPCEVKVFKLKPAGENLKD